MPEQGPRMNSFSLGELCWLFCCPPCPSRIAAKLAFLPPEPTYSVHTDASGATSLHLTERADWQYSQRELDAVEVLVTRTSRGNRVGCMFVRCAPTSRYTLLFSHGNAVDLGQMCSFYIGLGSRINCNVFSYDYSGYGVSTGKPSEKNLYADIEAAWQVLRNKWVFLNRCFCVCAPTTIGLCLCDVSCTCNLCIPKHCLMLCSFPSAIHEWIWNEWMLFIGSWSSLFVLKKIGIVVVELIIFHETPLYWNFFF